MIFQDCKAEATRCINKALVGLYHHGAFIPSARALDIGNDGLQFLRLYGDLAKIAFARKVKRFPLFPKFHYLNHQFLEVTLGKPLKHVINPLLWSVQMQEDFIGKPSRLARRVSPRKAPQRVLQRTLLAIRSALTRMGD